LQDFITYLKSDTVHQRPVVLDPPHPAFRPGVYVATDHQLLANFYADDDVPTHVFNRQRLGDAASSGSREGRLVKAEDPGWPRDDDHAARLGGHATCHDGWVAPSSLLGHAVVLSGVFTSSHQ
jgi:hypothetical protein